MTVTSTRRAAPSAPGTGGAHRGPGRRDRRPRVHRGLVLAVVLLAALAINIDTTIVNVALPTLNRELGSSTSGLQWVVDGYNLAFAALVLAGGNIGDRYGRRGALALGLTLFAAASVAAAECTTTAQLVGARFAMGAAASLVYPTTLSVITNIFRDRRQRAAAIGAWGAVSGLGVAIGPIAGGALVEHYRWGAIFLALVPAALVAAVGTVLVVPPSRDRTRPAPDLGGLGLSVLTLGGGSTRSSRHPVRAGSPDGPCPGSWSQRPRWRDSSPWSGGTGRPCWTSGCSAIRGSLRPAGR